MLISISCRATFYLHGVEREVSRVQLEVVDLTLDDDESMAPGLDRSTRDIAEAS